MVSGGGPVLEGTGASRPLDPPAAGSDDPQVLRGRLTRRGGIAKKITRSSFLPRSSGRLQSRSSEFSFQFPPCSLLDCDSLNFSFWVRWRNAHDSSRPDA